MPESWRDAEANASSSAVAAQSPGGGKKPVAAGEASGAMPRVPFHRLFAFADCTDVGLMLLGALGAPAVFVGFLVPIREAGVLLPQLLIAAYIRRLPHPALQHRLPCTPAPARLTTHRAARRPCVMAAAEYTPR